MTDDIQLTADAYKAHASQKVQPEDYEPFEVNVSVEGSVESVGGLSNGQRRALKARLLAVQKDLQEVVERSCENRIREAGHEDWSVPEREGNDD